MRYPQYQELNLPALTSEVLASWQNQDILNKVLAAQADAPEFVFYEGPPSANGTPGIHHVMARAIKDIFCRYKTQQGYRVPRKAGWDTHGLPVELQVEKELGIKKEDIGVKISIEEFNDRCREAVMRYTSQWNDLTVQMGYWVDLENPYITYDSDYIETLWYLLSQLYKKGLLYKGYTIQPYSPAAGTALSSHELNQPGTYKNVKDTSITAQFKLKNVAHLPDAVAQTGLPVYALAWTTTPWTLPANSALTVGKDIDYAFVKTFNPYTGTAIVVVMAEDAIPSYFQPAGAEAQLDDYQPGGKLLPYRILGFIKGAKLVGTHYEQLMPYVQPQGKAFEIISGDFVTTDDGTGIVHTALTFGADDYRVGIAAGISPIMVPGQDGTMQPIVDRKGRFVEQITDFAGLPVKNYDDADEAAPGYLSTDAKIAIKLKIEGLAFKIERIEHPYPHCWRTDKPVLYYPIDSWFIKTTAKKAELIALNKTINWKPEATGTGRFGNWLENLVDWNLSRSRFWGTPLPIWTNKTGSKRICIGSIAALKAEMQSAQDSGKLSESQSADNAAYLHTIELGTFDLHRPYVDNIYLVADDEVLTREPDLVDVWFDSGAMPYAQQHYPFADNSGSSKQFPADYIAEGVDQTRGWFFTLHALSVLLFDSVAYKNVVSNGLVLDKDGNKMSKRLGNAVDPFYILNKYGPDATRWYMVGNAAPWENLKFNEDGIGEVQRRFFGTLQNTYQFFALYANLDDYAYNEADLQHAQLIDNWILSRLATLAANVTQLMDGYDPTPCVRQIQDFVTEDLSNWYVRLNRKRFWKGELDADKKAAFATLHTCLQAVARLMAPFAPFYAERLYKDVSGASALFSVHLAPYPKAADFSRDVALEDDMELARSITSLIHSVRKKHNLKVRQPLSQALVPTLSSQQVSALARFSDLISLETNVKEVKALPEDSHLIEKSAKLNFKTAGRRFGRDVQAVGNLVKDLTAEQVAHLEKLGNLNLADDGRTFELLLEDVELATREVPGWIIATEGQLAVALDLTVSEELRREGYARELVNRIQNLRKDLLFTVSDKIIVTLKSEKPGTLQDVLAQFSGYIEEETQAMRLDVTNTALPHAIEVEGEKLMMDLSLANG